MKYPSKTNRLTLHVINHTHWDREWFVPYTFSRKWLPRLIQNLDKMVQGKADYQYLLDGQTSVMEDLAITDPDSYATAQRLVRNRNLLVGPYYSQIEIRMPGPESYYRNLRIGTDSALALGAQPNFSAWCVDMFGHISQAPQIHDYYGIRDVYLWRGPSLLEPFFSWRGADGTKMQAIFLFAGGYRNFYKVTSKARLAMPRLQHEVKKLTPYYTDGHIPVFDGFDLDYEPGDAASYFAEYHSKKLARQNITVVNSSPQNFAAEIRKIVGELPQASGELISGKYSSVFPGVLSNRSYSKLAADHCERLLYRYAEPLSLLLPADEYPEALLEQQCKLILQNLVHDVISGCSIDQVHTIAENRATEVDTTLRQQIIQSLSRAATSLQDGEYAYTPATGHSATVQELDDKLYKIDAQGIGISPVREVATLKTEPREVQDFNWTNDHYTATLNQNGSISVNGGVFGQFAVRDEDGDTYWDEPRGPIQELTISSPIKVVAEAEGWAKATFTASLQTAERTVTAEVSTIFDDSPLLKWKIRLNTSGTGFSVLFRHDYAHEIAKLQVGMPFDNVERPFIDTDLLGAELSPELASVLNASSQRDMIKTFTFPFHDYISPSAESTNVHLLAKGLRAYQTEQPGVVDIVLSRPVDWLMKPAEHQYHAGDAGPKYYVPDARSQREIEIDCALLVSDTGPESIGFHQTIDQYMNPPLIFSVNGSTGTDTTIPIFDENAIVSSLYLYNGKRQARIYNPTASDISLHTARPRLNRYARTAGEVKQLAPKKIDSVAVKLKPNHAVPQNVPEITARQWLPYPVHPDTSKPDEAGMAKLEAMYQKLQRELDDLKNQILAYSSSNDVPNSLQYRFYVTARTCMEARLSIFWNESALKGVDPLYVDDELYKLATEYNDLRIMRRMYDYIIDIDSRGLPRARPSGNFLKLPFAYMKDAVAKSSEKLRQPVKK